MQAARRLQPAGLGPLAPRRPLPAPAAKHCQQPAGQGPLLLHLLGLPPLDPAQGRCAMHSGFEGTLWRHPEEAATEAVPWLAACY